MRNFALCYINGRPHEITGDQAFMTVAEYLRYEKGLTGTKVVCSEGDCGACTILVSRFSSGEMGEYKSINSCISFMYLLDRCHIVTVEGLKQENHIHEAQQKMLDCHGAQCGFCTPGFICAMAGMAEDLKISGKPITEQKVKNYLTGNLCRCTGYSPIIEAGKSIDLTKVKVLGNIFNDKNIAQTFTDLKHTSLLIESKGREAFLPGTLNEVVEYKTNNKKCSVTSGATDLGVQLNKGHSVQGKILSLNNLTEAYEILDTEKALEIGAKASLTDIEKKCEKSFPEFSQMLHLFASPQIKNKGTLVGNIVNASPIADTIPFLMVAGAELDIVSDSGKRSVDINDFYQPGYKKLDLKDDELVSKVSIPKTSGQFKLYKVSVRKDLDISTVTFAAKYEIENNKFKSIDIAFGGVGPKVLKVSGVSNSALGQTLSADLFSKLADDVISEVTPMSDHRGSKEFRFKLCQNLLLKFGKEIMNKALV